MSIDASSALSLSAAEARAKNQGPGRGLLGAFLGSKYRGAMRSAAAASNASISKEVAQKRRVKIRKTISFKVSSRTAQRT